MRKINYQEFVISELIKDDDFEIDYVIDSKNDETLWSCTLLGLWKNIRVDKGMYPDIEYSKGDYYIQTMDRITQLRRHKGFSFGALFQDFIRDHYENCPIGNLYSTSKYNELNSEFSYLMNMPRGNSNNLVVSMGYEMSDYAIDFWRKQVHKKRAECLKGHKRYRAIFFKEE